MYNDTVVTIVGNVVGEPRFRRTTNGHAVASLRIASTPRRFDREKGTWVDSATLFVTVTCWRAMAENVRDSLHKGQPVVVTGRFYQREYEVAESKRAAYELEANAIGHDLSRGTAQFSRVYRPDGIAQVPVDETGVRVDDSDYWLGVQPDDAPDTAGGAEPDTAGPAAGPRELAVTG
jgi:single-strand DNA-binding protein